MTFLVFIIIALLLILAALCVALYLKNKSLQKRIDRIKERSVVKDQFLRIMARQIRTPIDSLVGFSDVCCSFEDLSEEERRAYLSYIHNDCEIFLRLIGGVLDVARYDSFSPEVSLEKFDLGDEIINIVTTLESVTKISPDISFDYSEANKAFITLADRTMLGKIMLNLVHNALQHTSKGTIIIHLAKADGDFVKVSVEDTGCGIPQDKMDSIFRQEYNVDSLVQGTGIGLFLCKVLVNLQGGQIGVKSEEGRGSEFWFTLPLAK